MGCSSNRAFVFGLVKVPWYLTLLSRHLLGDWITEYGYWPEQHTLSTTKAHRPILSI